MSGIDPSPLPVVGLPSLAASQSDYVPDVGDLNHSKPYLKRVDVLTANIHSLTELKTTQWSFGNGSPLGRCREHREALPVDPQFQTVQTPEQQRMKRQDVNLEIVIYNDLQYPRLHVAVLAQTQVIAALFEDALRLYCFKTKQHQKGSSRSNEIT